MIDRVSWCDNVLIAARIVGCRLASGCAACYTLRSVPLCYSAKVVYKAIKLYTLHDLVRRGRGGPPLKVLRAMGLPVGSGERHNNSRALNPPPEVNDPTQNVLPR